MESGKQELFLFAGIPCFYVYVRNQMKQLQGKIPFTVCLPNVEHQPNGLFLSLPIFQKNCFFSKLFCFLSFYPPHPCWCVSLPFLLLSLPINHNSVYLKTAKCYEFLRHDTSYKWEQQQKNVFLPGSPNCNIRQWVL